MQTFLVNKNGKPIMEGVLLFDGQCAINWVNTPVASHGCYASFDGFRRIQQYMTDREIIFSDLSKDGIVYTAGFQLLRKQDVTGISGTGIVAVGCEFSDSSCVLQWVTETPSTFWYKSVEEMIKIFGHNGKTVLVRK